jgi:hypothetical protein
MYNISIHVYICTYAFINTRKFFVIEEDIYLYFFVIIKADKTDIQTEYPYFSSSNLSEIAMKILS